MEWVVGFKLWLHFADDQGEEGDYGSPERWEEVTETVRVILYGKVKGEELRSPLFHALADLAAGAAQLASPAWLRRFTSNFMDTMEAVLQGLRMQRRGDTPSLHEYVVLHRKAGCARPSFDVIELASRVELSEEFYGCEQYQAFLDAASDVIDLTNDLYSVEKESAAGSLMNGLLILENRHGMERKSAASHLQMMIDQRLSDLRVARAQLPEVARSLALDVEAIDVSEMCTQAVYDWISGAHYWHTISGRFREPCGLGAVDLFS
ncbi:terpene synthase family protein [Streptomyces sp. NPDC055709]